MQASIDGLLHDAAIVRALVEFLTRFCEEQEAIQAYPASSRLFFRYIREIGEKTLAYLQPFVEEGTEYASNPLWLTGHSQKLVALKKCWAVLHSFVKPAADAHTLTAPVPLVDVSEKQMSRIENLTEPHVVLLVTNELNYFRHPLADLKEFAKNLKGTIPEAPDLPPGLVFLAVPFSQRTAVLTNTLLYHEVGHFICEDLKIKTDISSLAFSLLEKELAKDWEKYDDPRRLFLTEVVTTWATEIACDLIAVKMVGPAFTFAAVDQSNLIGELDRILACEFREKHPCDAIRFREQLRVLKADGWWDAIGKKNIAHAKLLESLSDIPESLYVYPAQKLVNALLALCPTIQEKVEKAVGGLTSAVEEFQRCEGEIQKALSLGIVPSTIRLNGVKGYPSPVVVMNAAFVFYVENFGTLINRIEGRSAGNVKDRTEMAGRLEMWVMKALEDYKLLSTQRV